MQFKSVLTLAIVAGLTPALASCGYHRIGTASTPLSDEPVTKPVPVRVAPKKEEPTYATSTYFPLKSGSVYTYARSYAGGGSAGTRVMTVASADGAEAWVNNRLEMGDQTMGLQYSARVTTNGTRLTAAVPALGNVHTLMSFSLKSPLRTGMLWDAEIEGRAWSFAARRTERVSVPAGAYDCLVVEGLSRSSGIGTIQHLKQTLYFAPNVGLVKLMLTVDEQRETSVSNQTLTEDLLAIQ